ncbi:phage tail protein [uncultured Psychroserpens sp.]|uniref:phage tail protein n=1 Tax=uncultured Psychroserpens sp. TaxID=255436 RepID=UPI00260C8091|nr:phage tail protein [uncultured Psychroserpens sp.]
MKQSQSSRGSYFLPKFRIRIDFSDLEFYGTEVSGLEFDDDFIEYRDGADSEFHKKKMNGLTYHPNIIIKKGTFKKQLSEDQKRRIEKLLEERNEGSLKIQVDDPEFQSCLEWTIPKTTPIKVKGLNFEEDSGLITLEELVFEHRAMSVTDCHQKP